MIPEGKFLTEFISAIGGVPDENSLGLSYIS